MATGITHLYGNGILHLAQAGINWASDTHKCTLHTSSYSPNYGTHAHQSDLSNEVGAGNGYSTGGNTLNTLSAALVLASALTAWATGTAYVVGQCVRSTGSNGHVYMCVVAGTSHASTEPTWPTDPGHDVDDNTVTWTEVGQAIVKLVGTIPAWTATGAGFTCRYAVIADTTPGSAATNPLIACVDFQADQTPSGGGTLTVTLDALGALVLPVRW